MSRSKKVKKALEKGPRAIVLRGVWNLLYGGKNRIYEYAPEDGVEGINSVWVFEWSTHETVEEKIEEAKADLESMQAWLDYLESYDQEEE